MGVRPVCRTLLVSPLTKRDQVLKELALFKDFHVEKKEGEGELLEKALKLEKRLERVIGSLNLVIEPGVIEILEKGYKVLEVELKAKNWQELLEIVERGIGPRVNEVEGLLREKDEVIKRIEEGEVRLAFLELISSFSKDLGVLKELSKFHARLAILKTKDIDELKKSLPRSLVINEELTPKDSLVFVIDRKERGDFVERVLKAFEAIIVDLPRDLPSIPKEAYNKALIKLKEERRRLEEIWKRLEEIKGEEGEKFLAYWEAAKIAREALENGTNSRRFFILKGYVPKNRIDELGKRLKGIADLVVEEDGHGPTLMENKEYVKSFESVTLAQGPPSLHEVDPTPIISVIFPIFYGLMFADAGQGLLLFLLGLFIYGRARGDLRRWGVALMSFGTVATIVGLAIGEVFGFSTGHIPYLGEFLSRFKLIEVKEFTSEVVGKVLTVGILFGIFHIILGLLLDLYQSVRGKEREEILAEKLPSLLLYIGGLFFALSFIGGGYRFSNIFSNSTAPLIGLPCSTLAYISLPLIAIAILLLLFTKPIFHKRLSLIMDGVIELLLKIIEFMANTISYARLGILLLVHVALMMVVNLSLGAGIIGIPLVIIGNVGVMMLEGLIVYIQALRLHVYEWFTKFYRGEGVPFRKFISETIRVRIKWTS